MTPCKKTKIRTLRALSQTKFIRVNWILAWERCSRNYPSTSKEGLIAKALLETLQDNEASSNTCPSQKQHKET
jgi:hypothetical protein